MSKLADAIHRTTKSEPAQIGFSPTPAKPRPSMLLVALIDDRNKVESKVAGADIVLLRGAGNGASTAPSGANGAAPLRGVWLQGAATEAPERSGYDFVVFDGEEAPASVLLDEEAGLVMQAPADLTDSLLQALQWMPLDALLVQWEGTLTVRRQLELQRLSGFSRKPLLLFVSNEPSAKELEALREAGVIGILVDLATADGPARLQSLRVTIDGLRPRPKRTRGDSSVVSVTPANVPVEAPEPQEPDEDDE